MVQRDRFRQQRGARSKFDSGGRDRFRAEFVTTAGYPQAIETTNESARIRF